MQRLLILTLCILFTSAIQAHAISVRPDSLSGWSPQSTNTAAYSFANGPNNNSFGSGSLQLFTGSGQPATGMAWVSTSQFDGRLANTLNSLVYSTYVWQNSHSFAPYIVLCLNRDGIGPITAADPRFVYEPFSNGTVIPGQWQRWDAGGGRWFATNGTWNGSAWVPGSREYHTLLEWGTILGITATATFQSLPALPSGETYSVPQGGISLAVGQADDQNFTGWNNFAGAVDGLRIGFINNAVRLYDFQPYSQPGDFDADLDYDGRDFLSWQRGNSHSTFSSADLAIWQGKYGSSSLNAVTAVPEPHCIVLLVGFLLLPCRCR